MTDLTICQDCQKNPAIYGDGLTWARCSECQYKFEKGKVEAPAPLKDDVGFEHKTIPGLTSIIMPVYMISYTLFHYTGNAIGSIREHTKKEDYELIIIDNGSSIKPPSEKSYYADKVVVNEKNEGVTKAWNKGIRISFGEYIVLINNDVQVFDGWLETMKGVIDRGEADLVMAHPMYSLTEPFARAIEANAVMAGTKKFDSLARDFSCVMFKKALFDEIGKFDEDFLTYCSDVEFLDRMQAAGKKFMVCDKVAIHHVSDATGFSIPDNSITMDKDKAIYEEKKKNKPMVGAPTPVAIEIPVSESTPESQSEVKSNKNENLVRAVNTGDRIYYKAKDGKIHWVSNPEVLHALGFEFGQDINLPVDEFAKLEKGETITLDNVEQYK